MNHTPHYNFHSIDDLDKHIVHTRDMHLLITPYMHSLVEDQEEPQTVGDLVLSNREKMESNDRMRSGYDEKKPKTKTKDNRSKWQGIICCTFLCK